jgi:hypothetical protein
LAFDHLRQGPLVPEHRCETLRDMVRSTVALAALVAVGCTEPTAVILDVGTDLACSESGNLGLWITTGNDIETVAPTPILEPNCVDGKLGTAPVVPQRDKQATLTVKVAMSLSGPADVDCVPEKNYRGCIVARRRIAFLPNTTLRVPITLYRDCRDVQCSVDETCERLGRCVRNLIDTGACRGEECSLAAGGGAEPAAGGASGGAAGGASGGAAGGVSGGAAGGVSGGAAGGVSGGAAGGVSGGSAGGVSGGSAGGVSGGAAGGVSGGAAGGVSGGAAGGVSGGAAGGVSGGAAGGVSGGAAGGVSGGAAGGVSGGAAGGVSGGVAGGVSGGAAGGVSGGSAGGVSGGSAGGVSGGSSGGFSGGFGGGGGGGVSGGFAGGFSGGITGGGGGAGGGDPCSGPMPAESPCVDPVGAFDCSAPTHYCVIRNGRCVSLPQACDTMLCRFRSDCLLSQRCIFGGNLLGTGVRAACFAGMPGAGQEELCDPSVGCGTGLSCVPFNPGFGELHRCSTTGAGGGAGGGMGGGFVTAGGLATGGGFPGGGGSPTAGGFPTGGGSGSGGGIACGSMLCGAFCCYRGPSNYTCEGMPQSCPGNLSFGCRRDSDCGPNSQCTRPADAPFLSTCVGQGSLGTRTCTTTPPVQACLSGTCTSTGAPDVFYCQ